jgi:hypothetical protein
LMGKTLILKSLLRSLNSISFMLIIFTLQTYSNNKDSLALP